MLRQPPPQKKLPQNKINNSVKAKNLHIYKFTEKDVESYTSNCYYKMSGETYKVQVEIYIHWVEHTYNPSTQKAEAGELSSVKGQSRLQSKFQG